MSIDRRGFLKSSAAGLAAASLGASGCTTWPSGDDAASADCFQHGIASGDPLVDRVILWTRVTPRALEVNTPIRASWWVAQDADGQDVIRSGEAFARPDRDFTIKVDVEGLEPGTDYYYAFAVGEKRSAIGRTRTLPDASASHVRMAFASCANYPAGYFNGYANVAQRDDLDVVLHLGDYLYEYANGQYGDGTELDRIPAPDREMLSLADYRQRHATYKADPDLQAAHARHPWITVWDDHESADNSHRGGAENHTPETEGDWNARRLAAIRAYSEWMPIRDLPTGLFRTFRFGELLDLVMLDTRLHGRDPVGKQDLAQASDPDRTILGSDQTQWLLDALDDSNRAASRWRVIGQQVIVSPMSLGGGRFNPDAWDGYRANRTRMLDHITTNAIDNVVFLTGDVHSTWVFEVPATDGERSAALEFVTPAISSPALGSNPKNVEALAGIEDRIPHLQYRNIVEQGYAIIDLTPERVRVEYVYTDAASTRSARSKGGPVFESPSGAYAIERVDTDGGFAG